VATTTGHGRGEIHRAYLATTTLFVRWLVDGGRQVRLFTGDRVDEPVVAQILADVRANRPQLDASRVVAEPASTLPELLQRLAAVDTVVASRYHNVLCALMLGKPTISVGYAAKHEVLMASMGLQDFCQPAHSVSLERLIDQFERLDGARATIAATVAERSRARAALVAQQFDELSRRLLANR
jgi:polysaccharide pyruvyl transferase WcaK-like protein